MLIFSHLKKGFVPIVVTESGMIICTNDLQPQNAQSPMDLTELQIEIICKERHSRKAASPIVVTDWGMVTSLNEKHHANASFPIDVTESGIMTFCSD